MNDRVEMKDGIEMNDRVQVPGGPIEVGHLDSPLPPSVDGAEVEVSGVPAAWTRGTPGFQVRVTYRNAPTNAGLLVSIGRDVPRRSIGRFVESGGLLTILPIPIEGNGTVDIRFDGQAYSAPLDAPRAYEVDTGRHIIGAAIVNHRGAVMGMVPPVPNARTLAGTLSAPIAIQGPPSSRATSRFSSEFQKAFEQRLATGFDLYTPGVPLFRYYRARALRFGHERICANFEMLPPFVGRVQACAPAYLRSEAGFLLPEPQDVGFTGTIEFQPNVVGYRTARDTAIATLRALPLPAGAQAHDPAGLPVHSSTWLYRMDERAWIFDVSRRTGGDGSSDGAIVRVSDNGTAAIAQRYVSSRDADRNRFFGPDPARPKSSDRR